MTDVILILTTAPEGIVAETIARTLVEERLAACVNVIPSIKSYFQWHGGLLAESEVQLMIKSTESKFKEIEQRIKELHPYETPEILALPVSKGSDAYLEWVVSETGSPVR